MGSLRRTRCLKSENLQGLLDVSQQVEQEYNFGTPGFGYPPTLEEDRLHYPSQRIHRKSIIFFHHEIIKMMFGYIIQLQPKDALFFTFLNYIFVNINTYFVVLSII